MYMTALEMEAEEYQYQILQKPDEKCFHNQVLQSSLSLFSKWNLEDWQMVML